VAPIASTPTAAATSAAAVAAAMTAHTTTHASGARSTVRLGQRLLAAAAVLTVVVAGAVGLFGTRAARAVVADGAELIAVMPLAAVSDSSLARLGQDLVVTLSTNFDGVGNLRTVDAVTLLMRARKLSQPIPIAEARTLAGELGARSVLTGTLISEGDLVRASVTLQMVSSDSTLAKATALALPRDIGALTDSLTWEVLRQVWRRGTAPSPVLAGLTTRSFEALRIFLEGERHFQRLETDDALRSYQRAIELDSNFVQAMLRYTYVRSWSLMPSDPAADARLNAARDRLPERERRWLEVTTTPASVPERIAATKALAAEYPEYPPALMSAADAVIHSGPLYGVAIEEAQPYLDRLDVLVPDHADTKMHQAIVALAHGRDEEILAAFESMAGFSESGWSRIFAADAKVLRAQLEGKPLPPPTTHDAPARGWAQQTSRMADGLAFAGSSSMPVVPVDHRIAIIRHVRTAGVLSAQESAAAAMGEGLALASRGDWAEALRTMRPTENIESAATARLTTARTAVLGAWVGALDPAAADSAARRASAFVDASATRADQVEARWLTGVTAVLLGDEGRVRETLAALRSDTARVARYAARSLEAVRMDRAGIAGAADSALAVSDDAMRIGGFLLSHQVVDRFIAARGLRRRGEPARAERYLMWSDAAVNTARSGTTVNVLLPLAAYERGMALDEAGDRAGAVYQLNRFITRYTRPPEAHRALVDDAKQRLARLEGAAR
jgi:tetratricopeptide (TPR) repeat protein